MGLDWMYALFNNQSETMQQALLNSLYSLIVLILLYVIKRYTMHIIRKKAYDAAKQFTTQKVVKALFATAFIIALLIIWQDSATHIITFIGFFTAGLAIAMRDIILNMIGALYILWANPFKVGDRVEITGQIGDVIDIRLLQFSILEVGNRISGEQSTGRITHIPNMHIFSFPLSNYEKGFKYIWHEIKIPVDKNSDWEQAKRLIYELLEEHTKETVEAARGQIDEAGKKYLIYYTNLTPTIYTEFKDNQIWLTVRYLCDPRQTRISEHILWEEVLKVFRVNEEIKLG
jgi:small-conductance mechanosensitive channel